MDTVSSFIYLTQEYSLCASRELKLFDAISRIFLKVRSTVGCSHACKVRFIGDEFYITNTFESIKTLSMRILLYKPVSIQLYPSDIRISVYNLTFQQWYNHRFGFGIRLVNMFLQRLGIPNFFRLQTFQMLYFKQDQVHFFFKQIQFGLDTNQALFTYKNQRSSIELNTRRGLRMFAGLPCRGQRTHTNASTAKKSPYYYNLKLKSPIAKNNINLGREGFDWKL